MEIINNIAKGIESLPSMASINPAVNATANDLRDKACDEMYTHIKTTIFAHAKEMSYAFDVDTNSVKLRNKLIKKLNDDGLVAGFNSEGQLIVSWE